MGDAMNPLNPNQILRILENGYFMTHQEQAEAAQYIRQLQQAVLDEREACAKIADDLERKEYEAVGDPRVPQFKSLIGKAIRARGEK
jgi:hypothetical protein